MVQRSVPREHVVAELVRLGVVLAATVGGYAAGEPAADLLVDAEPETARLLTSVLGALSGYLLGGAIGRGLVRHAHTVTERLVQVPASQLVAGALGGALGALLGLAIAAPLLLLAQYRITVPLVLLLLVALVYAGVLLGASRAAELGRFVGVRGRLEVRTPARGGGVKVVDTSALLDARIVDVARSGFLEGTLVVPRPVVDEVRRIADDQRDHRSALGQRGLRALQVLQDEGLVAVELDEDPIAGVGPVDEKLLTVCRERHAALITADAPLARAAEGAGIRVLNPHALADAVRSPVLPGDRIELDLIRPGREAGQAIGYLQDGTMVIVDDAQAAIGQQVQIDVTSIVQSRTGRLLFGTSTSTQEVSS